MPGLMALRKKYGAQQPLKGARIAGCLHMTVQTAAPRCNGPPATSSLHRTLPPLHCQDWRPSTLVFPDGQPLNMILDDGGDLTNLVHEKFPQTCLASRGLSEETTTGVHNLYKMLAAGKLKTPAINVNDSVTKSKFDNLYGCRESLLMASSGPLDVMLAGKVWPWLPAMATLARAVRPRLCGPSAPGHRAAMEGYEVSTVDEAVSRARIIVTATGCSGIIRGEHFRADAGGHHRRPFTLSNGRHIILLAEGRLVNLGCAHGHPQLRDVQLVHATRCWPRSSCGQAVQAGRLNFLPKKLDEEVAAAQTWSTWASG
uniref:AdoHcyase_NAD domain-containing protein n=1 Tax=Macrostomum lignano TaxID=282301 RepID=A0A1I8FL25_9PLAT